MPKNRLYLFAMAFLAAALWFAPSLRAQDVPPDPVVIDTTTQNFVLQLLTAAVVKFPIVATIIGIIGTMRLWAKPVFSFLHTIIDATPSTTDDGLWAKAYTFFTTNPLGKTLAFLLDWLGSIKLTPPVAKEPAAPTL